MPTTSRRTFLSASFAALLTGRAGAIDPIRRTGPAKLTLSLAAYSFNRYLQLRGKTPPQMTLEDFIEFGAKLSLPAVELTAYYFPKTTTDYLKSIVKRCSDRGLAVSGTAIGNDFCHPEEAKQKEQFDLVKRWTEHTALLGGKTMRIFAGSVKKGDTEEKARQRVIDWIQKACDFAAGHKVTLALENHGGITGTPEQLLALVRPIKSDWFGVNLDTGNFRTEDPYADLARVAPYAVVCQLKTEITPKGKKAEEADLGRLTKILREANYQGYVALEYEAAEDPKVAVPRYVQQLSKLMG